MHTYICVHVNVYVSRCTCYVYVHLSISASVSLLLSLSSSRCLSLSLSPPVASYLLGVPHLHHFSLSPILIPFPLLHHKPHNTQHRVCPDFLSQKTTLWNNNCSASSWRNSPSKSTCRLNTNQFNAHCQELAPSRTSRTLLAAFSLALAVQGTSTSLSAAICATVTGQCSQTLSNTQGYKESLKTPSPRGRDCPEPMCNANISFLCDTKSLHLEGWATCFGYTLTVAPPTENI